MMEQARNNGAHLRLGARVESVEENGPTVILKTGERIEADLVVGADGECMSLLGRYSQNFLEVKSSIGAFRVNPAFKQRRK
jgi:2-polyprenyl-6-methoxyphenol hydroxylase-like FAD-dependent oxidoreductase